MKAARRATTPTTRRIASTGQGQGIVRLASMSSASSRLTRGFILRVPYVWLRTRPHRLPLVSLPAEHKLDFAWGSTSMGYEDYFGCMITKASGIDVDTMHLTE